MRVSQVGKSEIKGFCREDYDDQDELIENIILPAAKAFICSYTALSAEELDIHEDITVALLIIASEMYDNRTFTVTVDKLNPTAKMILDLHDNNLV